jgi:hypothetical protein
MSITIEPVRARPKAVGLRAESRSIREVTLIGHPPAHWHSGDQITWAGRPYVVATDDPHYTHLRPAESPNMFTP